MKRLAPETAALIRLWAQEIEQAAKGVNNRMGTIQGASLFDDSPHIQEVEDLRDVVRRMKDFTDDPATVEARERGEQLRRGSSSELSEGKK